MVEGLGVAHRQTEERFGVEERLEDRPSLVEPVTVHFRAEVFSGSCRDDLQEPIIEAPALIVLAER